MTRIAKDIMLFFLFIITPYEVNSQFLNLQIRVEPELSAAVDQDLDFGTMVTNSGENIIELGDLNMGIFSIRAIFTQSIFVKLNVPNYLRHINPAYDDLIPLDLSINYTNLGSDDYNSSIVLENNEGLVYLRNDLAIESQDNIWEELFLYVYGSVNIGNISSGDYLANVTLLVNYD